MMMTETTDKIPAPTRERQRNFITSTLARQILSGMFSLRGRLPSEGKLGEQLGVSRTALRESMRSLAGKGLIESRPRSGTLVLPQSMWNHMDPELLAWRESLEPDHDFMKSLNQKISQHHAHPS